jgi:hypothetical protein
MSDTPVIRISRGSFDPARLADVRRMQHDTGLFLVPAIKRLGGLRSFYAGTSPSGSIVQVSLWDSDAAAAQLNGLKEMAVDARHAAEAAGVQFSPIVHYPIDWSI